MPVETIEAPPMSHEAHHRATFFRQSGWMMVANIGGGMLMWAVHFLSHSTGPDEYGLFVAFLAVAMCIPTMPLQMVMAQQTAQNIALNREKQLAGMARLVLVGTFALWVIGVVLVVLFQNSIMARWGMSDPTPLWLIMPILLFALWAPVFGGILQGQQNFFWLGWSMISNGIGRVLISTVAVLAFHGGAVGTLIGVMLGMLINVVLAAWQSRHAWLAHSAPFNWWSLLRQVIPLMLGFAAFQFLFTADTMFAKSYFPKATVGFYGSAGTLSRALMWLVGPLASVMFPRIVHSTARAEKSNLMTLVLAGTAVLSILGVLGLSILGPWAVQLMSGEGFVKVASSLLPWYAGAMVPLALANVLLNNLLAKGSFRFVPALCLLAAGYGFAMTRFHATPVMLLQTVGVCNLLLLVICAVFTWLDKQADKPVAVDQPLRSA